MQQSRSKRARKNPSPGMIKVTVHEKRRVNEEQPTPASSLSRNHDSAAPRQHPLIYTGAEPIHQVHGPTKPRATECSEIGFTFLPFSRRFRRVSWRVCKKSEHKRIKTHGTYHGQVQTLCTSCQLQRVAVNAPCRQEYSRRPCYSTLTNACGMKMS